MQKLLDVLEDLDDVQDVYPQRRDDRMTVAANRRPAMKVLVIGGGGREHALAWKLAQSPQGADGLRRARQRRHGARPAAATTSPITDLDAAGATSRWPRRSR